jgi:CheY-like chemotaxis protein
VRLAISRTYAIEQAEKERFRFNSIIADHRLGAGLTGVAAAKEISRLAGEPIPTLLLTGETGKEQIGEIEASGFAILHKPVDADKLRRELARLMAR